MKNRSIAFYSIYLFTTLLSSGQVLVTKYDETTKKYALANEVDDTTLVFLSGYVYDYLPNEVYTDHNLASANGKWFFINKKGRITGDSADYIDSYSMENNMLSPIFYKGYWSVIDYKGKYKTKDWIPDSQFFYDPLGGFIFHRDGNLFYYLNGKKWSRIDDSEQTEGEPSNYNLLSYMNCFSTPCPAKRVKWGYLDNMGREKIPFIYTMAGSFNMGMAGVQLDEKAGFIDTSGKMIIEPKYTQVGDFVYTGDKTLAPVLYNGNWGYIDTEGKTAIDFKFYYANNFFQNKAVVRRGAYGVIDSKGNIVIPLEYDMMPGTITSINICKKDGKEGVIDDYGKILVPFEFESMSMVKINNEIYYTARKDMRHGLLDHTGKLVVPYEYEWISVSTGKYANLWNGKIKKYFTGLGQPILDTEPK